MRVLLLLPLLVALRAQTPDYVAEGMKAADAKQYDAAIEQFNKAIAADAADIGAYFNLGLVYSLTNRDALAIPSYRKVLELKPDTFQAQFNLAMSLFNTGQFADAVAAYTKASELNPKSGDVELGLGRSLARLGQWPDASQRYRKAAAIDPSNRDYLLELATLLEEKGEGPKAVEIYRDFPENPGALERLGVLLLRSGDIPGATAALESAVQKSPTPANHIALAQAYTRSNQPAKAESHAAEALKADPADAELRMFYGQLLRDQHKFPQAATQFQAVAQAQPAFVPAWTELAGVLIMAEQWPPALAALDRVRALKSETAGSFFLRAIVEDRMQLRKEALDSYNKFLGASQGKNPDQEFQARQRVRLLEREVGKR